MQRISTLVNPKWLHDALQNKALKLSVVDTSWYLPRDKRNTKEEFQKEHIPGAQFFSIAECCDVNSPYDTMLPSPEQFSSTVQDLGISSDSHVVLYDTSELAMFSAQRTWWMFRVFGHQSLSILEGGLKKWKESGFEVTDKIDTVPKGSFTASYNGSLVKSYEDILENMKEKNFQLVDARPPGRFNGTAPEPRKGILPGNIPESDNLFYMMLQDKENQKIRSPEEIREVFKEAGIDLDKPIIATCGSGISAGVLALGAYLCGKDDVAVYDGSWSEYYLRAPAELKRAVPEEAP